MGYNALHSGLSSHKKVEENSCGLLSIMEKKDIPAMFVFIVDPPVIITPAWKINKQLTIGTKYYTTY